MYWVVLACLKLAEGFADNFVFWFPFYYELKALFVLWLILPQTQGGIVLYNTLVDPTLSEHEQDIDSALNMAQEQARNTGVEWSRRGLMTLQRAAVDGLVRGQHLITNQINNNQQTSSPQPSPREPSQTPPPSTGFQAYLPGGMLPENLFSRFYSSTSSTSSASSQAPAQNNTPNDDVCDSEDTIYDALPVDVQNFSPHDQEAYIYQQRKQLERMLRSLDVAQTELTQRTRLSRSASDSATRRRHRKNNNHARRSLMVTEEDDEEREFDFERIESFNGGEDMSDEMRRRQTRAVGLTSFISGYFAKAAVS